MSVVSIINTGDAVHMLSDGGLFNRGVVEHITNKARAFPHLNAAFAFRSSIGWWTFLIERVGYSFSSFDGVVGGIADFFQGNIRTITAGHELHGEELWFCGWSDQRQRFEAYGISSHGLKQNVHGISSEPWALTPIEGNIIVPIDSTFYQRLATRPANTIEELGIAIAECQRQVIWENAHGDDEILVGAHIQLTTVTKDMISQKILRSWPDKGVKVSFFDTGTVSGLSADTGSGGAKGLVPAPAAGDAAAGKFLKANGTWAVPSGLPTAQGRLTLTSGVSAPASVTGATSIYYTPHIGALIPFIESGNLIVDQFSEMSLAGNAAHAVNTNYDVFYFNDGGTRRIGTGPAWSTDNARGTGAGTTELTLLGGLPVNAVSMTVRNGSSTYTVAANAGLFLGTVRTTASAGVFDDSEGGSNTIARRFLWNAYNRVPRHIIVRESAASWSYTTGTWRRMNSNSNMQARFVVGLPGDSIDFTGVMSCQATSTPASALGLDWTSGAPDSACLFGFGAAGGAFGSVSPTLRTRPTLGYHSISALEYGNTGATFYGAGAVSNCGFNGTVMA